ncbi:hypothetical protein ACEPAI_11 [Sanghuangporus weigelae]
MSKLTSLLFSLAVFVSTSASLPASNSALDRREVSQDVFDQLTRFAQFSSLAYVPTCGNPLGTTLVQTINNAATDTQGYITRDDANKQIIVAFRGSLSVQDFLIDAQVALTPFDSQGVTNTSNSAVHSGFLSAYNSVSSDVISAVSSQLDAHGDYALVSTGHSLGGALASIGGVSLAANFPDVPLQVFTFGQPRTGNSEYAQLAEDLIGTENIFRAVHTTDGVPTSIPTLLDYQHHTTEYWQFQDPSAADTVMQCTGREDPNCSAANPPSVVNLAHITYFGQSTHGHKLSFLPLKGSDTTSGLLKWDGALKVMFLYIFLQICLTCGAGRCWFLCGTIGHAS